MMTKNYWLLLLLLVPSVLTAQPAPAGISVNETSRIIHLLASDSLKGRGNGQPGLLKAAKFIGDEFSKYGLSPMPGFPGYFIPFRTVEKRKEEPTDALLWNGKKIPEDHFSYIPVAPGDYPAKTLSDFTVIRLDSFFTPDILNVYRHSGNLLLWTDKMPPGSKRPFPLSINPPANGLQHEVLLVYAKEPPSTVRLMALRGYAQLGYTIAGMIPGRSKSGEVVLFSAHYDHLGVRKRRRGDSIMNGANDNASGTTALLMLAKYFAERNDNERTLLFCAFSGEEIGLKGSTDFLQHINPEKIVAGVNIEMIGVPQFGKKTVFITGEDYSSLAGILKENLAKNQLIIIGEPDPEEKQLFQRSDNYPFVLKGIPAHSIMGSDDDDPCYHKACDELKRIDVENMTVIIRAIAAATTTLINGPDAPARVKL